MAELNLALSDGSHDINVAFVDGAWVANLSGANNNIGYSAANRNKQGHGLYFTGGPPQGAQIDTAYIIYTASADRSSTTVNAYITGNKQASPFSDLADYQARRGTVVGGENNDYITTAQVAWNNIAECTANNTINSPEIKTVVQELVNQPTYNGVLGLFIDDHDGRSTQIASTNRVFYSYDNTPAKAPILHIEYTYMGAIFMHYYQKMMR